MTHEEEVLFNVLTRVRDIPDFCEKWPLIKTHFKQSDIELLNLPPQTKALFNWLYTLADRVCPREQLDGVQRKQKAARSE